mmetsp:Transcript_26243/g.65618  ORF Transcript_26243/g.65618 Transcript_26243/m.65618 type:complete len:329 (-) Transcript_26243:305-1291(-)
MLHHTNRRAQTRFPSTSFRRILHPTPRREPHPTTPRVVPALHHLGPLRHSHLPLDPPALRPQRRRPERYQKIVPHAPVRRPRPKRPQRPQILLPLRHRHQQRDPPRAAVPVRQQQLPHGAPVRREERAFDGSREEAEDAELADAEVGGRQRDEVPRAQPPADRGVWDGGVVRAVEEVGDGVARVEAAHGVADEGDGVEEGVGRGDGADVGGEAGAAEVDAVLGVPLFVDGGRVDEDSGGGGGSGSSQGGGLEAFESGSERAHVVAGSDEAVDEDDEVGVVSGVGRGRSGGWGRAGHGGGDRWELRKVTVASLGEGVEASEGVGGERHA